MLYSLKQTINMHESHIHSFLTHLTFICYKDKNFGPVPISLASDFITLPPLTLTSFKAMDVTLNYARFLKIKNIALYQKRTILIVSQFQYTQCMGSRPVKLKPISRGISSEWYTIFVSYNLSSEISQPNYVHVNTFDNVQILHPNANIDESGILSDPLQCKLEMAFF